jgi:hypothetical protein
MSVDSLSVLRPGANTPGSTFGPLYPPTKPTAVVAPAASVAFGSPVTRTSRPVWVQVALQPLCTVCQPVGQVNVSVQPLSAAVPLLVISTAPMKPLPQSLVSLSRTVQLLVAGLPVVMVSGSDDQETPPAVSRATTVTV